MIPITGESIISLKEKLHLNQDKYESTLTHLWKHLCIEFHIFISDLLLTDTVERGRPKWDQQAISFDLVHQMFPADKLSTLTVNKLNREVKLTFFHLV